MNAILSPIFLLATAISLHAAEPLTIGSPSPELAPMTFLRGDGVKELKKGTIYVVEFSGTQCGPCLKCVLHLNELQKKYPDVVLLSIYDEDEKVVRKFLAGAGKDIAFRVAADPSEAMWRNWSEAACTDWNGIPQAFVVGKDGKIAWIGSPWVMADPLAQIVAGTFDPQEDAMRLKLEQTTTLRLKQAQKRNKEGERVDNRISDLIMAGKLDAALAETEKASAAFRDSTTFTDRFRRTRLYLLANLPGRREEAFRLFTDLAVEAKLSEKAEEMSNTAGTLLNAAERATPATRDMRLVNLALALLRDPVPGDDLVRDIVRQRFIGFAYHLRGDATRATAAIREALVMIRKVKPPDGADTKQRLSELEAALKEYSAKAPPPAKDRR